MSRHFTRRNFLQASGSAFAGAVLLGGCGGSSSSSTVQYWGAFPSTETEDYFRENYIDAFNAISDENQVEMSVRQLTELAQQTDQAVSAGQAPDIVYSPGPSTVVGYAAGAKILELNDYAGGYGWRDALLPWAYELSQVDNTFYSLPTSYGSMVLYYNPATFEEHGWEPPTTKAEFEALCADAKREGLIPVGAGNSGYQAQTEWYLTAFLNMAVGPITLYETLTSGLDWDNDAVVEAITMYKEQLDNGWWGGDTERYFTNTDPDMLTGLANGDVAMYISGTWSFGSMSTFFTDGAEWDWAPLPSLSSDVEPGVFPLAIGTSLSISASTQNGDSAAEFLDFMVNDPERSLSYLAATGENPPPINITEDQFPEDADERSVRLYQAIPESANLGYTSWTFLPPRSNAYFFEEFDRVITGDVEPRAYCEGLAAEFTAEVGERAVPTPFTPEG
ncbi:ABC transporter substrate-binding protein [Nocardiopsis sediminis]|uniref:ABC transporter substrate-binding protein n=1 Tax=Nocardiopsis sediminis TaxID=1778267 RepID=A0ABV8FJK5_9ACTN